MHRLKILHVVPTYMPAWRYGGTIQSVHGLCRSLARLGHQVHVFTTNVDGPNNSDVPLEKPVDIDGVKVWYFPSRYFRRLYWAPAMKKALKNRIKDFDLLHMHSVFLWPTWMAARIAEKERVPYIVSPRGMLVGHLIKRRNRFIKTLWIRCIEQHTLKRAAGIHVTTDLEAKEASHTGLELAPMYVVPNGIDLYGAAGEDARSVSPAVAALIQRSPLILFISRISWKKGLDRLIMALPYVPEAHLVIVGNDEEGYRPFLEKITKTQGVSDRVLFAGPLYGPDKYALLTRAAVFALPSYSENFGLAVLEAMAAGCPVVVTPEVGLADIVRETSSGLVTEGNPAVLGKALKELVKDDVLRRKMGQNGVATVRNRFLWDSIALKMQDEYMRILHRARR